MPGKTSISDAAASAAAAASGSSNSSSNSRVIGCNSTLATSTPLGSYADLETVMEAEQVRGKFTKLCAKKYINYVFICKHIACIYKQEQTLFNDLRRRIKKGKNNW